MQLHFVRGLDKGKMVANTEYNFWKGLHPPKKINRMQTTRYSLIGSLLIET